ncbi:hypothetical protein BOX15_Mlig026858g2 [Macrostomum lignano]|uniref:Uncharacterized protein n=2 Tax=Macrostomum lignano TaxID=282301 RepID=A0A267H380_9PLAT|nr:hypothetical protein BOX15_Mlig026858g2 [Macrostomum lignano]
MPEKETCFDTQCITDHRLYSVRFKWTISNWDYVSMLGSGDKLSSSLFWSPEKPEIKCCMNLYPDGIDRDARGYLSLFLEVKEVNGVSISETTCQIPSKFDLILLEKRNNDVEMEVQFGKKHLQHMFNKEENDWGFKRFVEKGKLRGTSLSVICNLDFILKGEYQHVCSSAVAAPSGDNLACLAEDMASLLEDHTFADISIGIGETVFRAHKTVLAARSSVFKAMFAHRCKESSSNRVDICDTSPETWRHVMRFLYTGNMGVEHRVEDLAEILKVADKYEVNSLKAACADLLARQICFDNFEEILLLAHMHKAAGLKQACCQFMKHSAQRVVCKPEWEELQKSWPDLTSEVLTQVIRRSKKSS